MDSRGSLPDRVESPQGVPRGGMTVSRVSGSEGGVGRLGVALLACLCAAVATVVLRRDFAAIIALGAVSELKEAFGGQAVIDFEGRVPLTAEAAAIANALVAA